MSKFTVQRDRDAWATIRGYRYQIDRTIQQWLALAPQHVLELERGEDIDEISEALAANNGVETTETEVARIVEQVKHRIHPMTLHSSAAVSALANAIEHRATNPGLTLTFRYTSNAAVGWERGRRHSTSISGITLWERLRKARRQEFADDTAGTGERNLHDYQDAFDRVATQYLTDLRRLLQHAKKPGDLPFATWDRYTEFVTTASDGQLFDLIRGFEWSTGHPDADSMRAIVEERLIYSQHALTVAQAAAQYDRLFVYVMRRLSVSGIKRLTREELLEQLALPALPERDRAPLRVLETSLQQLSDRLAAVEDASAHQAEVVEALQARVNELARAHDASITPNYRVRPEIQVPPLVVKVSRRTATVQRLRVLLTTHPWLALRGDIGAGKTQLAILLTQSTQETQAHRDVAVDGPIGTLGSCRAWVRLRDLTPEQAGERLDAALTTLLETLDRPQTLEMPPDGDRSVAAGTTSGARSRDMYRDLCAQLGQGASLVLEDVPRLTGIDALSSRLLDLVGACRDYGVRLLTTSRYALPQRLVAALDGGTGDICVEARSPSLTDEEVGEMLTAAGAPPELLQPASLQHLKRLAAGHPMLVTALARYLAERDWRLTSDTLARLEALDFAQAVNTDTLFLLQATVPDPQTRDLLYRLTLIGEAFSPQDAAALAAVAPAIAHPREQLAALDGLWTQHDAQQRYVLSPLVQSVGSSDLSPETAKQCHRVLGDRIVQQRRLDPLEVLRAMTHFQQAEEFDIAGVLFSQALTALQQQPAAVPDWGMLSVWAQAPLPADMSLGLRLYIRALQIGVRRARGLPTEYLVSDVDQLLKTATEAEAWAVLAVAAFAGVDAAHAMRYLRRALQLFSDVRSKDGKRFVLPEDLHPAQLLWTHIPEIETAADLTAWLDVVEQLTPEDRTRFFADETADVAALTLADRFWIAESERPVGEQRWDEVLMTLRHLQVRAERLGIPLLRIAAIRAQIVVLAEHLDNVEGALALGQTTLADAEVAADARMAFLLYEVLGRQSLLAKHPIEALGWLRAALAQPMTDFPWLRVVTNLHASVASSGQDPSTALIYAQEAVDVAEASPQVIALDTVKALGELAIAAWDAEEYGQMAGALERAGERLLTQREETAPWHALTVAFSVVTHALAGIMTGRQAYVTQHEDDGTLTADGASNAPHAPHAPQIPKPGAFVWLTGALAAHYDQAQEAILCASMVEILTTLGDEVLDGDTATWLEHGFDVADATHNTLARIQLDLVAIPVVLLRDQYGDALECAFDAGQLITAMQVVAPNPDTDSPPPEGLDVQAILGEPSSALQRQAHTSTLDLMLLPTCLRLASLAVAGDERLRGMAETVARRCREFAVSAAAPDLWGTAADLFEEIFMRGQAGGELLNKNTALMEKSQSLGLMGWIGATLDPQLPLVQGCVLHLAALRYLTQTMAAVPGAYTRLVAPFILNYWTEKLETHRPQFRDPDRLRARLKEARDYPLVTQTYLVLSAVADGLGVQLSPETEARGTKRRNATAL